jgi:ABC-2 type transport system ATP-binding protein
MITIENLNFNYQSRPSLFKDLDLHLPSGNIYGLLGKNGAGKTTLLKIISGLLFPASGNTEVIGFKPASRDPRFLREVYLINEEFSLPSLKMDTYIRLYSPFYPRFQHQLMDEYIQEFKLPCNQELSGMSYGQKKNFLLSFGLATDCKLLLLDEPTNGLDIPSKSLFRKIVANAVHEERCFIISTHQVRDMESLIDPVIILDEGKIIFHRNLEQISRRIFITRQTEVPKDDEVIYFEHTLGGYTVIKENTTGNESRMNLEILFNAVITHKEKIINLFNSGNHEAK